MRKIYFAVLIIFLLGGFNLAGEELKGPKKRIAVVKFEDKSGSGWYRGGDVGEGMSDMLVTALFKSSKFMLVEREDLNKVMDEQKLGKSGLVTAASAAQVGKLLGANVIVIGSVTEFGPKESSASVGGNVTSKLTKGLINNIGLKTNKARVVVDIKMIDTTTGEIILAETGTGEKKARNINFSSWKAPSFKIGGAEFDGTLIGKATREAIDKLVNKISGTMENVAWSGYVLKASGKSVYINAGEDTGIKEGMILGVEGTGEEIEDADGNVFVIPGDEKGEIKIIKVMPKISIAKVVSGEGFEKDDKVIYKK